MESYRRLEASSLEAIRSLNATVDAKDPYTAGHSARVQRIAVAAAEELGLPRERLDAGRLGGLFHDIGKIGVPDSILTKPGALDAEEFEAIKRHPADGAEIVSHFSSNCRGAARVVWDANSRPPSSTRSSPRFAGSRSCSSRTSRRSRSLQALKPTIGSPPWETSAT
ncbi:hypothetical protein BH18ACT12_BH18ACT12_19640 [soil metagenome]